MKLRTKATSFKKNIQKKEIKDINFPQHFPVAVSACAMYWCISYSPTIPQYPRFFYYIIKLFVVIHFKEIKKSSINKYIAINANFYHVLYKVFYYLTFTKVFLRKKKYRCRSKYFSTACFCYVKSFY